MLLHFLLLFFVLFDPHKIEASTRLSSKLTTDFQELERTAASYDQASRKLEDSPVCSHVHVGSVGQINIIYLHCPDEALVRDGESVVLSENFTVPSGIARRYNFWRRIYSIWSKEQYVMHSSQYPEIVFAAYDGTHLPDNLGPEARERAIKRVSQNQREQFRHLLQVMHNRRDDEAKFTPAMRRVARQMAHIRDGQKYLIAARSLRLQRGQRDFIETGLSVAPKYLPAIEQEFANQGVPVEISRLAFVESSFNLKAVSKVGASGVFQIMPATGKQYLKIHSGVDERNDPIKAAKAACQLLKLNYKLTGSWPLAITAYNHGVGGIRRAINQVGSTDIVQLINKYEGNAFGFASKNFYASFLGMLATLNDADRLFPNVKQPNALAFETLRISQPASLTTLSRKYNFNLLTISSLNPDLSRSVTRGQTPLPVGYVLKIPSKNTSENSAATPPRRVPNS